MRRLYESSAVKRDDDDPTKPNERREDPKPEALRSVPAKGLSNLIIPARVGRWGIRIRVSANKSEYTQGEDIPFEVVMKNSYPFPVTIKTQSPIYWMWDIDGHVEASKVSVHKAPDTTDEFVFDRGERKIFTKRWDQMFKVAKSEWEPAQPGEYTIRAAINAKKIQWEQSFKQAIGRDKDSQADVTDQRLSDSTTIHIRGE